MVKHAHRFCSKLKRTLRLGTKLRSLERALFPPQIQLDSLIPEIRPFFPKQSCFSNLRLNLVVYSINLAERFGGIQSSLDLLEELGHFFPNLRILITSNEPQAEDLKTLPDFVSVSPSEESLIPKQIQFLGASPDRSFYVGKNDVFITHGWWEAYRAEKWTAWQSEAFCNPRRELVFMIQEFEPGCYPFSSRYALANQALKTSIPHIAVINTSLLADHYRLQGYKFQKIFCFEPSMNIQLLTNLEKLKNTPKEKILFCYCRQTAERNAFELVALALREWAQRFSSSCKWTIISAGAPHDPFEIAPGVIVRPKGKLTLENYSNLLSRSAVGLSLMISPHPSYPPLEFAHYGMRVLTNSFGTKDISSWHDNICSVADLRPEKIASELAVLCRNAEKDLDAGWHARSHMPSYLSRTAAFPFIEELAAILVRDLRQSRRLGVE